MPGGERMVTVNGVELCVEEIGDPRDPALLLIMGVGSSMLSWEDAFCARLAAGGRRVIRYDHRDTGRSVTYPPGAPGYTSEDLVGDAAGVIDAVDATPAHVVGISAGGAIAQLLALDHPDRVATLTLISTSTGPDPDLPPVDEALRAHFAAATPPDWGDRETVIAYLVDEERAHAAPSRPFDEAGRRALAARIVDRSVDLAAAGNHLLAEGGGRWRERLGEIRVPTLVLHGDEDPLFPLGHGRALADEIPGARLVVLERMGHELPSEVWDAVVPEILGHTAGR